LSLPAWANVAYLVASVMFIFGIKGMTHPRTAVRGNLISAIAMLIAVVVTLTSGAIKIELQWWMVIVGLAIGGGVGAVLATRVQMTGMPQLVGVFNGFGGAASTFVAGAELVAIANRLVSPVDPAAEAMGAGVPIGTLVAAALAGIIGTVTLTGSFVAFGKLQDIKAIAGNVALPGHQLINAALAAAAVGLGVWIVLAPEAGPVAFLLLAIVAALLGVMLVLPIGGADMPVVIALLNSYSGLAAAATGFVLTNNMLIIAGSLVGASGLILTAIMCKAMNRSLVNVLFGKIEAGASATADEVYEGKITATSAEELAMMLDGAQRVVIVPGYGMAVAQAQHAVRDLFNELESREVNVEFAIHPVAGRMPGHMNVLLAEVDIPYDKLIEAEQINPTMETVDMAIVLGANDVVNPDARKSDSPIAGMPIVEVDKARTVVVIKRSLSPGFAGIPNPLFAMDNALMYFGDGKKAVTDLVAAVKEND
jgi:NAD(P) transhydrogenase subunit beta